MTEIIHLKDNLYEIRTREERYIQQLQQESLEDDFVIQCEKNGNELRVLIELAEEPDSDSSFLDKLRYIH